MPDYCLHSSSLAYVKPASPAILGESETSDGRPTCPVLLADRRRGSFSRLHQTLEAPQVLPQHGLRQRARQSSGNSTRRAWRLVAHLDIHLGAIGARAEV